MKSEQIADKVAKVVLSNEEIQARLAEIAKQIDEDYAGKDFLIVGVLKGAMMVMADLSRHMQLNTPIDWMAVSSYGSGTQSSGVVKILKDLDTDIEGKDVLLVEDIVESGLTLSWLTQNLKSRGANSVEIFTLLRKPEGKKEDVEVRYVGFDIPMEFIVGYGLDYDQNYRNLENIVTLRPEVYS